MTKPFTIAPDKSWKDILERVDAEPEADAPPRPHLDGEERDALADVISNWTPEPKLKLDPDAPHLSIIHPRTWAESQPNGRTFTDRLARPNEAATQASIGSVKFRPADADLAPRFDSKLLPHALSFELCEAITHSDADEETKDHAENLRQDVMGLNRLHIGMARKVWEMMPQGSKQRADAARHLLQSIGQLNLFVRAMDEAQVPVELRHRVVEALTERMQGYGLRHTPEGFQPGEVSESIGSRVEQQIARYQRGESQQQQR